MNPLFEGVKAVKLGGYARPIMENHSPMVTVTKTLSYEEAHNAALYRVGVMLGYEQFISVRDADPIIPSIEKACARTLNYEMMGCYYEPVKECEVALFELKRQVALDSGSYMAIRTLEEKLYSLKRAMFP